MAAEMAEPIAATADHSAAGIISYRAMALFAVEWPELAARVVVTLSV